MSYKIQEISVGEQTQLMWYWPLCLLTFTINANRKRHNSLIFFDGGIIFINNTPSALGTILHYHENRPLNSFRYFYWFFKNEKLLTRNKSCLYD